MAGVLKSALLEADLNKEGLFLQIINTEIHLKEKFQGTQH